VAVFETNFTGSAHYDDVIYAAIITDQVLDALMASVVTPPLLAHYNLAGKPSKAVDIPKADKFTAADLTEGVELTNTRLTDTKATLTAAEVGIMATITDVLDLSDIPAAHGARLRQLGRAMADKLDLDVTALAAGFSTTVGTTTVDLDTDDILQAIMELEVENAPKPFVGVLHPVQVADLRTSLASQSVAVFPSNSGIRGGTNELGPAGNGYFGSWFGIDFFFSTNVATANAAADRAGMIFSKGYALGMVEKWAAKVVPMYWPPIRGWVLTATAMYGVGEIEDNAGVKVVTDA
jgi:N4-gp56 family major capsid protein